jgi:hypothetical protein
MIVIESNIEKINDTFTQVKSISFNEKKNALHSEEIVNTFLDKILELKRILDKKTQNITKLNTQLEELTWFSDLDDECLMKVNEIISLCNDLHSSLLKFYIGLNPFIKKGIAKAEIKELKEAIADLKEITQDVESRFFFLPQMPIFTETTKELTLI